MARAKLAKKKARSGQRAVEHPASILHASHDPFTGRITVVRTPARPGVDNLFTFAGNAEMRTAFSRLYQREDIDRILHEIANSGSADFSISH